MLPVLVTLSALCMESVVVWRRLVGVGLGVPRILGSGLALLGGRGSDIRELSTNQMLVLICINQSDVSIDLYQPMRSEYCFVSTNESLVLPGNLLSLHTGRSLLGWQSWRI